MLLHVHLTMCSLECENGLTYIVALKDKQILINGLSLKRTVLQDANGEISLDETVSMALENEKNFPEFYQDGNLSCLVNAIILRLYLNKPLCRKYVFTDTTLFGDDGKSHPLPLSGMDMLSLDYDALLCRS